jgi:hypothetical protein
MAFDLISMLTEQTCGEACWHAREDICRCSCGGKNHGCLRTEDGVQPARTSKIDGHLYELKATGKDRECTDLWDTANRINLFMPDGITKRYSRIEKPITCQDGQILQYTYTWKETESGAPARVKYASKSQIERWPELASYRNLERWESAMLLWVRVDQPVQPTEPIVK